MAKIVDNFNLIRQFLKFEDKDDFYFLQIIERKKDGNNVPQKNRNNGYRTVKSYYIRSMEEFDHRVERIKQLCSQNNARAYINLNVRSAKEVALVAAKSYIDLVREDRCHQGHRVYDHACGITPKSGVKRMWVIDVDDLTRDEIDALRNLICKFRSSYPLDDGTFDNIVTEIPTLHGVHIITHGFDVGRLRDILEQTTRIRLTPKQIKEITEIKKDNPTLLYFEYNGQED